MPSAPGFPLSRLFPRSLFLLVFSVRKTHTLQTRFLRIFRRAEFTPALDAISSRKGDLIFVQIAQLSVVVGRRGADVSREEAEREGGGEGVSGSRRKKRLGAHVRRRFYRRRKGEKGFLDIYGDNSLFIRLNVRAR